MIESVILCLPASNLEGGPLVQREDGIMNRYESLFIVSPTLDAAQIGELTEGINALIQDSGGNVLLTDHWGQKRLAYAINKHSDGYYIFLIFDAPPDLVSKLNNYFLITEMIMRHVVLTFNGDLEKFVTVASQRSQGETSAEEDSATRQSARDSETSNEDDDEGQVSKDS